MYMAMIRKQVYIAPQQDEILKRLARQTHKSEAEIIRDAIEEHARALRDKESRMKAWRAIEATADRMKQLPAAATRSWTREDLYDRYERSHSLGHKRSRVRL
jgi:hypothetical protein